MKALLVTAEPFLLGYSINKKLCRRKQQSLTRLNFYKELNFFVLTRP